MSSTIVKHQRLTGSARASAARDAKTAYDKGASIREISEATGRSYGAVHKLLTDNGVTLRGRGGATRTKSLAGKATAGKATAGKAARARG